MGVMTVFAGERIVESHLLGAKGYVNPFGNYVPLASSRICDYIARGMWDVARRIQHGLDQVNAIIAEGHPLYGHQCYSKALAAAQGHPVGDVRPPLTRFDSLGQEGRDRVARILPILQALDALVAETDAAIAADGARAAPVSG
ncbi:MAG: hypothetical protein KatS3mg118_1812 [Paracoccaceae bacterium]|nr:MAG: hypothetical protein KatS3mg118_1812 [Paracoccaceae bacterium]